MVDPNEQSALVVPTSHGIAFIQSQAFCWKCHNSFPLQMAAMVSID